MKIWIPEHLYTRIRSLADQFMPMETGGLLMGYRDSNGDTVITDFTGPGPNAIHAECSYIPDYEHDTAQADLLYHASGRLHVYLGDWHTHPKDVDTLSRRDIRALKTIADTPCARVAEPLMIILVHQGEWTICAWSGRFVRCCKVFLRFMSWRRRTQLFVRQA